MLQIFVVGSQINDKWRRTMYKVLKLCYMSNLKIPEEQVPGPFSKLLPIARIPHFQAASSISTFYYTLLVKSYLLEIYFDKALRLKLFLMINLLLRF